MKFNGNGDCTDYGFTFVALNLKGFAVKRIYTWQDQISEKIVEVSRTIDQYNVPPTCEEAGFPQNYSGDVRWIKFVDAAMIGGNLQKGNYGRC